MDREQFKQQVLPLREPLKVYALRLVSVPDETEDIVQEVFFKLWDMRERLDQYRSIAALSFRIARNLSLNRLKILKRKADLPEHKQFASPAATPDTQAEHKESFGIVMRIIDRLPYLQQAVLKMKHIEGLEVEDISELTGTSAEAVRMNLSRARRKVKELFLRIDT